MARRLRWCESIVLPLAILLSNTSFHSVVIASQRTNGISPISIITSGDRLSNSEWNIVNAVAGDEQPLDLRSELVLGNVTGVDHALGYPTTTHSKFEFRRYDSVHGSGTICSPEDSLKSIDECVHAANILGYRITADDIFYGNGFDYNWAAHGCYMEGLQWYFFLNNVFSFHPSPAVLDQYLFRKYICLNNAGVQEPVSKTTERGVVCPRVLKMSSHVDQREVLMGAAKTLTNCLLKPMIYFEANYNDFKTRAIISQYCPRSKYGKAYYTIEKEMKIVCIPKDMQRIPIFSTDGACITLGNEEYRLHTVPDSTIIQIGAHVGNTINDPVFERVDENTKLILVEPVPYLFNLLKKNYKLKLPRTGNRIIFLNKAVGNYVGKLELTIPSGRNNFAELPYWASQLASSDPDHIRKHLPDMETEVIQVATTTIDEIVQEHKLDEIFLLKTDAEGMDYDILMHYFGGNFSAKVKPRQILFEHNHMEGTFASGTKHMRIMTILSSLGYKKAPNYLGGGDADTLMVLS